MRQEEKFYSYYEAHIASALKDYRQGAADFASTIRIICGLLSLGVLTTFFATSKISVLIAGIGVIILVYRLALLTQVDVKKEDILTIIAKHIFFGGYFKLQDPFVPNYLLVLCRYPLVNMYNVWDVIRGRFSNGEVVVQSVAAKRSIYFKAIYFFVFSVMFFISLIVYKLLNLTYVGTFGIDFFIRAGLVFLFVFLIFWDGVSNIVILSKTVFFGIIVRLTFNKNFDGAIYASTTDLYDKELNFHEIAAQSGTAKILTGNDEFDNTFLIRVQYVSDAERLLSNEVIKSLLEMKKMFNRPISFFFQRSELFIVINGTSFGNMKTLLKSGDFENFNTLHEKLSSIFKTAETIGWSIDRRKTPREKKSSHK